MGKIRYVFLVVCVLLCAGVASGLRAQVSKADSREVLADFANRKFAAGDSLLRKNDAVNALLNFDEAISLYEMVYEEYDIRLARVLKVTARLLADKGYASESVPYAEKALLITQSQEEVSQKALASMYLLLGKIHRVQGRNTAALPYILRALDIYSEREELLPTDELVLLYVLVGNVYYEQEEFLMSARYLEMASNFILPETGELNQNIANLYESIGRSYMESDSTHLALKYLRKSTEITKHIYGQYSQEVALVYSSIAAVHFRNGQYDSASMVGAKVVDIYEQLPEKSEELINYKRFLGKQYFLAGAYTTSAEWYTAYLDIKKAWVAGDSLKQRELAVEYIDIANAFGSELVYHYAFELYEGAFNYHKAIFGNSSVEVALLARKLGKHYMDLGNNDLAIEKLGIAASIFQLDRKKYLALLADVWTDLGTTYGKTEKPQAAITAWKEVLKVLPEQMNNQKASVYHAIALNYYQLREVDSAYHYAKRESVFYENVYHGIHIMMPNSCLLMGNVLMLADKKRLALSYFETGWRLSHKAFEEKTTLALAANNNLSALYKELGEEGMAEFHSAKASKILISLKNLR